MHGYKFTTPGGSARHWSPFVMVKMEEGCKQALRDNHHDLRSGVIVKNILADFRRHLTDIEYLRVDSGPGDIAQVDELVRILLTKENKDFDGFCRVLERNGYPHWGRKLRAEAYACGREEPEGMKRKGARMYCTCLGPLGTPYPL